MPLPWFLRCPSRQRWTALSSPDEATRGLGGLLLSRRLQVWAPLPCPLSGVGLAVLSPLDSPLGTSVQLAACVHLLRSGNSTRGPAWRGVGVWELFSIMFPCVHSSANELGIALAFATVITLLIYNELTVKRLFKAVLYTTPSYLIFLDLFF